MMTVLRIKSTIFILCFLPCVLFSVSTQAATLTWTGGGVDNLASNPSNWTGAAPQQSGDSVIFDSSSSKDCAWDLDIALASLTLGSGYTGAVTLNFPLRITGDLIISGGTLDQNNQTLLIGFSPPAASTDSGTSTNGSSATLNATVNPNGIDTNVYFECRTGASYDVSTAPQSIGNGTTALTVSADITGLLPDTAYQCRVVVTNAYGTVYGNNVIFTTSPITIIYPLNGTTISRPDVMVRGNIINTSGNETGVSVNGMVAVLNNNEFVINHVPFIEGANSITVTATDTTGSTSTASITIDALTTLPYVTLSGNIESGTAPLTTYFSVSTSIPNSVASYAFDYEGDGTVGYAGTTFENINCTYAAEGIYYPTVTVTDDQNNTYTDTIAIAALNATQLDTLLRGKWEGMSNSLSAGDVASALTVISTVKRTSYNGMFTALSGQLQSIMNTRTEFNLVSIKNNIAKYELITSENGTTYSYDVIFSKDSNGIWMIQDF